MKKSNYELYEIINSLDERELRFIRKQLKANQTNTDLALLFNIIEKHLKRPKIDENEITISFKKPNFTKRKYELNQIIQDCIIEFQKQQQPQKQYEDLLSFCQYLFDRNHVEIAHKKLVKLKEEIIETNNFSLLLNILNLEKQILFRQRGSIPVNSQAEIEKAERNCLNQLNEINQYWHLLAKLYEIQFQKLKVKNTDKTQTLAVFNDNPLLQKNYETKSFKAQVLKLQTLATLAFIQSNANNAYNYNKAIISLFNTNIEQINELPKKYFAIWCNYIIDCSSLKKTEELENSINQIQQFLEDGRFAIIPQLEEKVLMRIYNVRLNNILKFKEFENANIVLQNLNNDLQEKLSQNTAARISIVCFMAAQIAFITNEKETSKEFLAIAYMHEKSKQVELVVAASRMLEIIIFYEETNYSLAAKFLKRLKNYLKYRKLKLAFETEFMHLFNALLNEPNKHIKKELYSKYQLIFQQITDVPEIYNRLFINNWLTAKQGGYTFINSLK